jgi:predicted HAD superfamily Cof-like phosphohydrolase
MSNNWVQDINEMHTKYGVHEAVEKMNNLDLRTFLNFRINFLKEELNETMDAANNAGYVDAEEVVDGLIDLCVVAIGTLDAFGIDAHKAWDAVLEANMNKEVGIKESRPNPLGLPDLIKPEGWTAPSHEGNHGDLAKIV